MGSVSFLLIPDCKGDVDFAIFVLQSHSTTCGCITSYSQSYWFFSFRIKMSSIKLIRIHYIPLQSHCNSLQSIANWLHSAIHCKLITIYHNPLQTHCNILYVFANSCFIQNAHINTKFYNYILTLQTSMQMLNGGHVFFLRRSWIVSFKDDNGKLWLRMISFLLTSSTKQALRSHRQSCSQLSCSRWHLSPRATTDHDPWFAIDRKEAGAKKKVWLHT